MSDWVNIGHGVSIQVRSIDDEVQGVAYRHPEDDSPGGDAEGWIPFAPRNRDGWELISLDPLTVSPSLLCRHCGHHGFIRDGRWIPA